MIVVTGATGHIGNVLVRALCARGDEIKALTLAGEDPTPLAGLKVKIVEGDIRNPGGLIRAFQGADVVYHLAGIMSILPRPLESFYQVNVLGTRAVVRACLKNRVRRLVFTSSALALAGTPKENCIDETLTFDPDKVAGGYARSKALASREVLKGVDQGLDAVIVCPTSVIGPFDYRPSEMGEILIGCIKRRPIAYVTGAYNFVDVRDVAVGHMLAEEKGRTGENYLLGGERMAVRDFLVQLEEATGVRAPTTRIPIWSARIIAKFYYALSKDRPFFNANSIRLLTTKFYINTEKARRELGFAPRPIRRTIVETIAWFRERGVL